MTEVLIAPVFAALMATVGVVIGWCLRGGSARAKNAQEKETRHAQLILQRLRDLTARVAADVGEHTTRVAEINEELAATEGPETDSVLKVVDKLLETNQQMQQQLKAADQRLREQAQQIESHVVEARTDALTGLANRRALDDVMAHRINEHRQYGRTFSLALLDVDHFKKFNDTYGHQAGDAVLRGLANVLRRKAREGHLVARYGGEEFALVMPDVPADEGAATADAVREAIARSSFRFGENSLQVTVSIGVAEVGEGEDAAGLFERADGGLYASKDAGRNRTHWHDAEQIQPFLAAEEQPDTPEQPTDGPRPPAADKPAETPPSAAGQEAPATAFCDRHAFIAQLGRRVAEWRRGGDVPSMLLVRIDELAQTAATHGEQGADVAVQATRQFLTAALREMDLLARYDVGTFAVLLPKARLIDAAGVAERLRKAIAHCSLPLQGGRSLQFTVSVGGAEASGNDNASTLLARAAAALQAAQQSGGNCSYFHNGQWSATSSTLLPQTAQPPAHAR